MHTSRRHYTRRHLGITKGIVGECRFWYTSRRSRIDIPSSLYQLLVGPEGRYSVSGFQAYGWGNHLLWTFAIEHRGMKTGGRSLGLGTGWPTVYLSPHGSPDQPAFLLLASSSRGYRSWVLQISIAKLVRITTSSLSRHGASCLHLGVHHDEP